MVLPSFPRETIAGRDHPGDVQHVPPFPSSEEMQMDEKEKKALAIIEQHAGDLVYIRPEDLQTQRMFIPQVTVLHSLPGDFHDRKINGKIMPKSHHVDRIGEAAGVDFVAEQCGTRKEGDRLYVGWAQGRRRLPDGTWRKSSKQEYEFDVDDRAKEDFLRDTSNKYKADDKKELHIIELKKAARQRASTGARLRVIRELVGIPIAFEPDEIKKALVVSRIAVNTDVLLDNPETRQAAVDAALGHTKAIYGPEDVTSEREALPDTDVKVEIMEEGDQTDTFDTFDEGPADSPPDDERQKLDTQLNEWLLAEPVASSPKAMGIINEVLSKGEAATLEEMGAVVKRCQDFAKNRGGKS